MSVQAPGRPDVAAKVRDQQLSAVEPARGLAVAGVLLSAVVHLDLWYPQGFRHIATIGPLFCSTPSAAWGSAS
jgi:hypothetical protein